MTRLNKNNPYLNLTFAAVVIDPSSSRVAVVSPSAAFILGDITMERAQETKSIGCRRGEIKCVIQH
jgi:hypothetical protein